MTKNRKYKARTFEGISYRKVQRKNLRDRNLLTPEHQKWLKTNGYRNIGWDNVIKLYQKIRELINKERIYDSSLEDLFLEADRIGNKYLSSQEIQQRQQKIALELNEIANIIDSQYPDNKIEVVDYSKTNRKYSKNNMKKKCNT